jgi:pimeloyl-ACP methyl ester carboxylesterase
MGFPLAAHELRPVLAQSGSTRTFVLAHGAWHGGWCWKRVVDRLRAKGHAVYTPSFTGMGDRIHLLNKELSISTFLEDLVQVIISEELTEVVLVGHSFGGIPISGVADRIARLIYLDALIIESGRSAISYFPPDVEARIKAAEKATNGFGASGPRPASCRVGLRETG